MAYQSWSVVFGEQPSAAKWNILGSNDASFNDGTGIADGAVTSPKLAEAFFRGRRQNDDSDSISNSAINTQLVQVGWSQANGDGTSIMAHTITFPEAFSAAPIVFATGLGVKTSSVATSIADLGAFANVPGILAADITTTGCTIRATRYDAGVFAAGNRHGVAWLAIGPAA